MKYFDWFGKSIVLASQSPRRSNLLRLIGLEFKVHPSDYHEINYTDQSPAQTVLRHAREKARSVARSYDDAWIIGADTIVVLDQIILGKPQNREEAVQMLEMLSGKTHLVYTGYCIYNSSNHKNISNYETTRVSFRRLSGEMIGHYIDHYPPFDKAGSYGIQDFSAVFVEKLEGCFYNVVGFPLSSFYEFVLKNLRDCL